MRYAIVNRDNILFTPAKVNTKASRYPVNDFLGSALRRVANRACARQIKKQFKNPRNYNIIDTKTMEVVR